MNSRPSRQGVPPLDKVFRHLLSLKNPFILGHESADPDAVASAYGLSLLLNAPMGFPSLSRDGKRLLEYLSHPYELSPDVAERDVIVVDANRKEMLGGINIDAARSITVIDHHTSPPTLEGALFIFPEFSSTAEIVLELLKKAGFPLTEKLRNSLLVGILYDTKNLLVAGSDTLRRTAELLKGRRIIDVVEMFQQPRNISERIARLKALRKGTIYRYGDFLVVVSDVGSFEASVASLLVSAGADVAVVYGKEKRIGRLSIRASGRMLKLGFDATKITEDFDCGGHEGAVGCHCSPEECERIANTLKNRVLEFLKAKIGEFVLREY